MLADASVSFSICFWCLKEPYHLDGSFEYPQHMFWLRNKKKIYFCTHSYTPVAPLNVKNLIKHSKCENFFPHYVKGPINVNTFNRKCETNIPSCDGKCENILSFIQENSDKHL